MEGFEEARATAQRDALMAGAGLYSSRIESFHFPFSFSDRFTFSYVYNYLEIPFDSSPRVLPASTSAWLSLPISLARFYIREDWNGTGYHSFFIFIH
ncbi:hypothetical protein M408DRAFT_331891 [Serendipita vermifera MAFF 305830]|uniref:Uncharacterized protein n=1 Tax=Serendipita vermifera MAFF 305830 TaxID=933852 RepID=A0A0C2VYS6_SERVB|nr:hypothetical protein M408DRAFT_334394 [Serendipita vermifera MAFF 305830]KIM24264.1 hypothetical protein M408DRAFT_331891 [Serendipita vermifera MAFF 305830]